MPGGRLSQLDFFAGILVLALLTWFDSRLWGILLVGSLGFFGCTWFRHGASFWTDLRALNRAVFQKPIEADGTLPDAAQRFARAVGVDRRPVVMRVPGFKLLEPVVEALRPRPDAPKLLDRIELQCDACGYRVPPSYLRLLWLKGAVVDIVAFSDGGRHPTGDGSCPKCGKRAARFTFKPS